MTKSGIGTESMINPGHSHHHHQQQQQPNASTSSIVISKTEIPIWVSDRKKWVTGINKRTTVNDLIFAVLKQCQVISGGQLIGVKQQLSQSKTSLNESNVTQATLMEQIANLFVLVEYYFELDSSIDTSLSNHHHHGQCTSQRLLDNDSKVYKYFNKWLQSPNSYMLKILQRQIPLNEQTTQTNIDATTHTEQINNMNNNGHSSLATKLLRKFGVSSTNGSSNIPSSTASINTSGIATNSSSQTSHIPPPHLTSAASRSSSSYRFVDVKLPVQAQPQSRSKSNPSSQCTQQQNHSPTASNSTTSSNNTASSNNTSSSDKQARTNGPPQSFDPAAQKVFLYNSIVDKENKLRQQRERFKLIDELLKETEKKSSKYMSSNTPDSMLYDSSVKPLNLLAQLKHAHIDLADIYSNFPEMRTNNLEDVEEFSQVCNRLFQLDEDIKEQKEMLNKLESELQRELNSSHLPNNNFSNGGACGGMTSLQAGATGGDSVETMQLRKEVSLSREQTRIQCKQLHDLDAKMRLNEQSLALKEQQLQKLLEELYIEEMYADSALENEMTHNESSASFNQNGRRSRQQADNEPNNMDYYYDQDVSHNNNQSDDHLIINDELLMNSDRVELSANNVEFDDDTLPIHHHNIDYIDHHLNQMLLNAANAKQIELKINNEVASNKYSGQNGHHQSNGGGSIRIAGSNQFMNGLTPSQKSLSYGNLLNGNEPNSIKINNLVSPNTATINQPTTGQKLNGIKTYKSNTTMNINNGAKPGGMKTSPSLDLNKAQQQHNAKKGVDQSGNTGDNDSGISSVSSEATTTITTNHTTMLTTTSSSSSCQNIAGNNQITNIPINMMNQYQRQQYFQQQQIQRQYQAKMHQQQQSIQQATSVQAASSSSKPVLETLV